MSKKPLWYAWYSAMSSRSKKWLTVLIESLRIRGARAAISFPRKPTVRFHLVWRDVGAMKKRTMLACKLILLQSQEVGVTETSSRIDSVPLVCLNTSWYLIYELYLWIVWFVAMMLQWIVWIIPHNFQIFLNFLKIFNFHGFVDCLFYVFIWICNVQTRYVQKVLRTNNFWFYVFTHCLFKKTSSIAVCAFSFDNGVE